MGNYRKALLFYNHEAGLNKIGDPLSNICHHLSENQINFSVIELPKSLVEIRNIVSQSIQDNFDLFIAAGGDGTVSMVSDPLIGTGKPLGIIPLGTGNVIAKSLDIPLKIDRALDLITQPNHDFILMDALRVNNDRHYISNVSVGVSPELMATTCQDDKKRMGFFAYLISLIKQLLGLKLHRYYLEFDHQKASFLATEILITNGRSTGIPRLKWSEDVSVDDGELDILILKAANILDFLGMVVSVFTQKQKSNPCIKQIPFREFCKIESRHSRKVQADGDVVGRTPIEVKLITGAVKIIANK